MIVCVCLSRVLMTVGHREVGVHLCLYVCVCVVSCAVVWKMCVD